MPGNDRPAGSLDHSSKSSVQDRFRGTQPILQIDDKTGSSDLPVGRSVDRRVESYFGIPQALLGRKICQRLGRIARRGRVCLDLRFAVIASAAKQSILSFCGGHGLLRCARNDGSTLECLRLFEN